MPTARKVVAWSFLFLAGAASGAASVHEQQRVTPPEASFAGPSSSARVQSPRVHRVPATYYALPDVWHGASQSPVNILSTRVLHTSHAMRWSIPIQRGAILKNTGKTLQVRFDRELTLAFDGKRYGFGQIHFHTPSEHQVDGVTYPMEAHLVGTHTERSEAARSQHLVLAVLFRMGSPNRFVGKVLHDVPEQPGESVYLAGELALQDLFDSLPSSMSHYFHYRGSLTTPPYTEGVDWLVLKHEQQASQDQIMRVNALEGDNARHVQRLGDRLVDDT